MFNGVSGPIAVDATGTVFVNVAAQKDGTTGVFAVNTSNVFAGRQMKVMDPKESGTISPNVPAGVKAMSTYVNGTGNSKLVVLEAGGAGRYIEFDLTEAGCGNASVARPSPTRTATVTIATAVTSSHPPPPPAWCTPQNAKVSQVWNNIMPFGGVGSGWVYDVESHAYGWGVHGKNLLKLNTNVSDGDWSVSKAYEGLAARWLLYPNEYVPGGPHGAPDGSESDGPAFVQRHGVTYLVLQHREKQVYKYNATTDKFAPCAGIVVSYVNVTDPNAQPRNGQPVPEQWDTIQFVWHDGNNDGTWTLPVPGTHDHQPDYSELEPFEKELFRGWNYFYDSVQDDLSFIGPDGNQGFWHWPVDSIDTHGNPVYAKGPVPLMNDSVLAARFAFNASTMKNTCPTCQGLPPTHGGNELSDSDGTARSSARFVDGTHTSIVTAQGAMGSQFAVGCFSQDSCPQWKLAWHTKDPNTGRYSCKWRVGRAAIAKATGEGEFANSKPDHSAGVGAQPMTVHPIIGNTVSVNDMMRAGVLIYTTDGVYVDTLFTTAAGGQGCKDVDTLHQIIPTPALLNTVPATPWRVVPRALFRATSPSVLHATDDVVLGRTRLRHWGCPRSPSLADRKNFHFGATVFEAGGEYFAESQMYVDPASGKVFIAWGKTSVMGFEVDGMSKDGVATEPVKFAAGYSVQLDAGTAGVNAVVTLAASNIAVPLGIASQLRGYPPKGSSIVIPKATQPPALDGSLTGWGAASTSHFTVDGLNVNGPAVIDARLLYDADTIYIHWTINQTQTGWPYPLPDLEPITHMFAHGRGSTTCSFYIQGNVSAGYSRNAKSTGRPGDSRFVFGLFKQSAGKAALSANSTAASAQMGLLAMYPFWDPKFGPGSKTTYAVGWHNVTLANVAAMPKVKRGFAISPDGSTVTMAAALPRSAVPWLPAFDKGLKTSGDFSCNIQGFQKDWWTNFDLKASQIAYDEPSEASELCPASWGNFTLG